MVELPCHAFLTMMPFDPSETVSQINVASPELLLSGVMVTASDTDTRVLGRQGCCCDWISLCGSSAFGTDLQEEFGKALRCSLEKAWHWKQSRKLITQSVQVSDRNTDRQTAGEASDGNRQVLWTWVTGYLYGMMAKNLAVPACVLKAWMVLSLKVIKVLTLQRKFQGSITWGMVIIAVLGQIYSDNPTKHGVDGFENEPGKQCRQSKYQA